jgi:3-deoxy-alpha-D-manno-octulosonate 8-oxidase
VDKTLDTGIRNVRNVGRCLFGSGRIKELGALLDSKRQRDQDCVIFLVDEFFKSNTTLLRSVRIKSSDRLHYVSTKNEPTTAGIDDLAGQLSSENLCPGVVVGIGGGITLDTAKAVSNLMTNGGKAAEYQGWDLVRRPGIYKVGVPTLSGTGAEATRTCVMTNKETGLKLGMNSDHTVFDQLILDPQLTATVPREQYFFSGMDAWIHCIESLNGKYRNPIGDAFSHQAISLCDEVFSNGEMMSESNRSKLMVASYLGGCAIATSYVGLVHPFSAGLSVVLGLHHCVANCIAMTAMEPFYPQEFRTFMDFLQTNQIELPSGTIGVLDEGRHDDLYQATIVHSKPLTNALGENFRDLLTRSRVRGIFEKMI